MPAEVLILTAPDSEPPVAQYKPLKIFTKNLTGLYLPLRFFYARKPALLSKYLAHTGFKRTHSPDIFITKTSDNIPFNKFPARNSYEKFEYISLYHIIVPDK